MVTDQEVNDEWILRRLERWGRREVMPFVGPAKGVILQRLVKERRPQLLVEVGTMAGEREGRESGKKTQEADKIEQRLGVRKGWLQKCPELRWHIAMSKWVGVRVQRLRLQHLAEVWRPVIWNCRRMQQGEGNPGCGW